MRFKIPRLFRHKVEFTDIDPKVVGFFFQQYVELMKHGRDECDNAMKFYVADIITQLGVPETLPEDVVPEIPALPLPEPSRPVIVRTSEQRRALEEQRDLEMRKKYGIKFNPERKPTPSQRNSFVPECFGRDGDSVEDFESDCEEFEEDDIEGS